ncbi:MAG: hypothetical protein R2744_05730 [Bacteroidales bacterium]
MSRTIKITLLLLMASQLLTAQKLVNSPFARFGPGILEPQGAFSLRSMGGAAIGQRNGLTINYLNPASYSAIDTNSFVFDFGLDYQFLTLKDATGDYTSDDGNFHHMLIGFPLGKKAGFAFGIVPFSSGYYNISSQVLEGDPGYDPIIGETENLHKGTGGYNKFFFGLGISPFKNLSVGANMEFLFGSIFRQNTYIFLDGSNYYNNSTNETILIRGFNFNYGLQYNLPLSNDHFATAGITYSFNKDFSAEYEALSTRYSLFSGSSYSVDTLTYTSDNTSSVKMPGGMSIGFAVGKKDKYTIAIDYTSTRWDESNFPGYDNYLVNSNSINFGIGFIPDKFTNTGYFNRVEYRVGGHTSDSHLMINGEQIKDFGITFGVGLPLGRTNSRIDMHFEYGQRKVHLRMDCITRPIIILD